MATGRSIPGGPAIVRRASLGAIVGLLLTTPLAHAKCGAMDNARLRVATTRVTAAVANAAAAGTTQSAVTDAQTLVSRARRNCSTAAFAYAVATAARQDPAPATGTRMRIAGVDLLATVDTSASTSAGAVVWRLDVLRAAGSRHPMFPSRSGSSVTWSIDPTRPAFNPTQQSDVLAILARRRDGASRANAAAGARTFALRASRAATARLGVLTQLTIAQRLSRVAQVTGDAGADRAARSIVSAVYRRVGVSAGSGGWSRVDGAWSTRAQHKAMLTRTVSLLRRYPNARTTQVVRRLRAQFQHGADVRFRELPAGVFYPWPRDGAFDSQHVTVHVDKPGTATIEIYGAGEAPVRSVSQPVQPGDVPFAWDGALADGAIAGPGEYSYVVVVDDITGRRTRTPGLQTFTVARDTTAPAVASAALAFARDGALGPRIVATWKVDEPLSPIVRTQLRLARPGGKQITVLLADSERAASVRRAMKLGAGTWNATFIFTDGSGNVATKDIAPLVVR